MTTVDSPCVRNCCLNEDDICLGCFRSIDEILQWGDATDEQKLEFIELANARKIKHQEKYGSFFVPDSKPT